MIGWLKAYRNLIEIFLNILVVSKSVPNNPIQELKIDTSYSIIYLLPHISDIDIMTLRSQCLIHNLPDPLDPIIIENGKFCRCISPHPNDPENFKSLECNSAKNLSDYLRSDKKNVGLFLQVVPVSVFFGRAPTKRKKSSSSLMMKYIKKIFSIVWLGRDSFVYFYSSIPIQNILDLYKKDKTIIGKLARIARIYFLRQSLSITGSISYTRRELFQRLLASKSINQSIKDDTKKKRISFKESEKNALILMNEIASNVSYEMMRLTDRVLRFTWRYLYKKISVRHTNYLRKITQHGQEIVYIPCHRSHMDYLLLSYVLYHKGLMPPHIAAGINLNFWPIGAIFRRLGAFFIRRSFRNNKFYYDIFREYLYNLLRQGRSVEYFIEGKRSRTGRLLDPKTGILSITIQAVLDGCRRPIVLVPIYIGYEHVIELDSYYQEVHGAKKKKENLFQIILSMGKLRNLGHSYINFGQPIFLNKYLKIHLPQRNHLRLQEKTKPVGLTTVVNNIAKILMTRINDSAAVNSINLCAVALLASHKYTLNRKQLVAQIECYMYLIINQPNSKRVTIPTESADALVSHALNLHKLASVGRLDSENISFHSNSVHLMSYYRNNIIHLLVIPSAIARIIIQLRYTTRIVIVKYIRYIYPFLKRELFLRWKKKELENLVSHVIDALERRNLIFIKQEKISINAKHFFTLNTLATSSYDILLRYFINFYLISNCSSLVRSNIKKYGRLVVQSLLKNNQSIYFITLEDYFDIQLFNSFFAVLRSENYVSSNKNCIQFKEVKEIYTHLKFLISEELITCIQKKYIEIINCS